jgi:hypothetical protein
MEPESLAQWYVLRAQVQHHEPLHHSVTVAWTDSGMGKVDRLQGRGNGSVRRWDYRSLSSKRERLANADE